MGTGTVTERTDEAGEATSEAAGKAAVLASEDALQFCREILLLEESEPVSLDMVLAHAILGSAQDLAFLKRQCAKNEEHVTLALVKATLTRVIQEGAQAAARLRGSPAKTAMSPDDAASIILSYCTPEVHDGMQYAQEIHGEPYHKIIAAMLCLQYENLAGGDFSQVSDTPLPVDGVVPPPARPVQAKAGIVGAGGSICSVLDRQGQELCGKPFVPGRRAQKYGCHACGEVADFVANNVAAMERKKEDPDYIVSWKIEAVDKNRCTCS